MTNSRARQVDVLERDANHHERDIPVGRRYALSSYHRVDEMARSRMSIVYVDEIQTFCVLV